jgi:hypothetical protein
VHFGRAPIRSFHSAVSLANESEPGERSERNGEISMLKIEFRRKHCGILVLGQSPPIAGADLVANEIRKNSH